MDLSQEVARLQRHVDRAGIQDTPISNIVVEPIVDTLRRTRRRLQGKAHKRREPLFFMLWAVWLFVGTMFYAFASNSDLGIVKGFYMAINIGYSIGFGYPSENDTGNYVYFSSLYVLLGASFVGVALGFFAEKITKDSESWFTKLENEKKMEEELRAQGSTFHGNLRAWMYHNASVLKAVSAWAFIIVVMITYSMIAVGWPFGEAQYFAISTLSTGGHWPIPNDSPLWLFGVTALLTMVGVPVMAVAMAEIAQVLITKGDLDEARETIDAVVSKAELEFLLELGLEDFDGSVDRAEFIILCMVRMGTDPGLITYITKRFAELNFYTGQALTVAEITQGACKFVKGEIRRAESVQGFNKLKVVSERDYVVPEASNSYLDYYHNKMDASGASMGDSNFRGRERKRTPALAAVPEDVTQSKGGSQIQERQSNGGEIPEQREILQSSMRSPTQSSFHRNGSLELGEVFGSSRVEHVDGPSLSSTTSVQYGSKRISRKERVDAERQDSSMPPLTVIPATLNTSNQQIDNVSNLADSKQKETTGVNRVQLTYLAEKYGHTELAAMEEGKMAETPSESEDEKGLKHKDAFHDEVQECRLEGYKRYLYNFQQEPPTASRERALAKLSSEKNICELEDHGNDGRSIKRNYANYLFSKDRSPNDCQTDKDGSHERGSAASHVRSSNPTISEHNRGQDTVLSEYRNLQPINGDTGYHNSHFTYEDSGSVTEAELPPRPPKKSFSSYLMRGA